MSTQRSSFRSVLLRSVLVGALPLLSIAGCPLFPQDNTNNNTNNNTNGNVNGNTNDNANDNTDERGDSGLTGKFIGSERCSLCHNNTHSDWSETLHSRALESLEAIGQDKNEDCIGCHTVGFGEDGGFVDRKTTNALAGVGCEACHGAARDHAENVADESLRPTINIAASVCGRCHTDSHHPNFEDWSDSKHAAVEPELVPRFAAGSSLNSCGKCHSGDYFYHAIIKGETVDDNFLEGKTSEEMNGITCAVCHNPHAKTGNAATPEDGRDYQLRYPQIKYTEPSVSLADATDPTRFNLCGQCHHSRERVWTDSSREPHPSDQVNVFFGELPVPDSDPTPIVPVRASVHLNASEQCSTCHVYRAPATELNPTVSGHTFAVNLDACAECHGTREIGEAKLAALRIELEGRAEEVHVALEAWGADNDVQGLGELSWEYTSEGGPDADGQALIPDDIKKARYIYYYVIAGGGNGVHNPDFVRDALIHALDYATNAPDVP